VNTEDAKVPYLETVRSQAKAQGRHKRQTGGKGQFGDCWIELEPMGRGDGFTFENKVVGGSIPKNFIPAIEKGIREAMDQGLVAGFPASTSRSPSTTVAITTSTQAKWRSKPPARSP